MSPHEPEHRVTVIGVGAMERGDDAAGRLVAREVLRLAPSPPFSVQELRGETTELMQAWINADVVILVDAASTPSRRSLARPGTLHRFDASVSALPAEFAHTSTHDMGVSDAIELARAMGMLPKKVIVFAIEVDQVAHGTEPSPEIRQAIPQAAMRVIDEAYKLARGDTHHA